MKVKGRNLISQNYVKVFPCDMFYGRVCVGRGTANVSVCFLFDMHTFLFLFELAIGNEMRSEMIFETRGNSINGTNVKSFHARLIGPKVLWLVVKGSN